MKLLSRNMAVAGIAAMVLAVGGGAAFATTAGEERDAFLSDIASRLGVEQGELEQALQGAQLDRLDAAVEDGEISEDRAAEIRERIESGEGLLFGGFRHHHRGGGAGLETAAAYLEMTPEELRDALPGSSLAQLAEAQGKSVEGLEQALVDAKRERLNQEVADGRLTEAEAQEKLAEIESRVSDKVNREVPEDAQFGPRGFGKGEPPPAAPTDSGSEGTTLL